MKINLVVLACLIFSGVRSFATQSLLAIEDEVAKDSKLLADADGVVGDCKLTKLAYEDGILALIGTDKHNKPIALLEKLDANPSLELLASSSGERVIIKNDLTLHGEELWGMPVLTIYKANGQVVDLVMGYDLTSKIGFGGSLCHSDSAAANAIDAALNQSSSAYHHTMNWLKDRYHNLSERF